MLLGRRGGRHADRGRRADGADAACAAPVRSIDPTIPPEVDALVTKCLQPDPRRAIRRWRSCSRSSTGWTRRPPAAAAATSAMARRPGAPTAPALPRDAAPVDASRRPRRRAALPSLVAGLLLVHRWRRRGSCAVGCGAPPPAGPTGPAISLAILPFRNARGSDARLARVERERSPATLLGQSAQVRTVPSERLQQVLQDLRIAGSAADAERAQPASPISRTPGACCGASMPGSATRSGSTRRCRISSAERNLPLNAEAPKESLLTASQSWPSGAEGSGAGIARYPHGAEVDLVETVDHVVRGAASLQRRPAADAAGHPSGGAQAASRRRPRRTAISRSRSRPGPVVRHAGLRQRSGDSCRGRR